MQDMLLLRPDEMQEPLLFPLKVVIHFTTTNNIVCCRRGNQQWMTSKKLSWNGDRITAIICKDYFKNEWFLARKDLNLGLHSQENYSIRLSLFFMILFKALSRENNFVLANPLLSPRCYNLPGSFRFLSFQYLYILTMKTFLTTFSST